MSKNLRLVIVTPEKAVLDTTGDAVVLPMFDGELGVLPGRAPLIGRLGAGELRLTQGKNIIRYYIDGGFAQINSGAVTVLTEKAVKAEDISITAAEAALTAAQKPATSDEGIEKSMKAQTRARAMIRIAKKPTGPALQSVT